ncbi:hypothetical protein BaRGS_00039639 [Batillaria attramentaria]|uniref:Secreted protein n=1 Tax=Batillaria attramentaria TaxID=370345 RepID=A0ABD0J379_9CAEN
MVYVLLIAPAICLACAGTQRSPLQARSFPLPLVFSPRLQCVPGTLTLETRDSIPLEVRDCGQGQSVWVYHCLNLSCLPRLPVFHFPAEKTAVSKLVTFRVTVLCLSCGNSALRGLQLRSRDQRVVMDHDSHFQVNGHNKRLLMSLFIKIRM